MRMRQPPSAGAQLVTADTAAAEAIPGVSVVRAGAVVGVLAADRPTALAALAAIRADWREAAGPSADDLESYLRAHPVDGEGPGAPFRHENGAVQSALDAASVRIE